MKRTALSRGRVLFTGPVSRTQDRREELELLGEAQRTVWMGQAVQERAGTIGVVKDGADEVHGARL